MKFSVYLSGRVFVIWLLSGFFFFFFCSCFKVCNKSVTLYFPDHSFKALNTFSIHRSKAVPLLQFFFVRASVTSFVALVLSLFVPHLSYF